MDNGVYREFLDPNFNREKTNKLTPEDEKTISEIEEYNKNVKVTFQKKGKDLKSEELFDISTKGLKPEETLVFLGHGTLLGKPFLIPQDYNVISYTRTDTYEFSKYIHIFLGSLCQNTTTISKSFDSRPFHLYQGGDIIINNVMSFSDNIDLIDNPNIRCNPCLFMLSDKINEELYNWFFLDEAFQGNSKILENIEKSVNYIYDNYFKHSEELKRLLGVDFYTDYIKGAIKQNLLRNHKITNIKEFLKDFNEYTRNKIKNLIFLSCRKIKEEVSAQNRIISRRSSYSPHESNNTLTIKSARHLRPPKGKFEDWQDIPFEYFTQFGMVLPERKASLEEIEVILEAVAETGASAEKIEVRGKTRKYRQKISKKEK